jgi:hypothetical protein
MSNETYDLAHKKNWKLFGTLTCNSLSIYSPFIKYSHRNYSTLFISHVCFQLGVQDHLAFKLTHMTYDLAHKKNWKLFGTLTCSSLSIYSPFIKYSHCNYSTLFISHVCFQLGVQDHLAFKLTHMTCMTSNFDVLNMHGNLRR